MGHPKQVQKRDVGYQPESTAPLNEKSVEWGTRQAKMGAPAGVLPELEGRQLWATRPKPESLKTVPE